MENPEEVLQALDEFQKMRPSEIPRELEEYLSWVAKTGDPVYQWSLVKPLFREKLTRVMTDFYESCPSLELAPCPNVEQFNYDFMKCNLLELLESFANAPFTVQRICELLTAPRKEYNRVDKFMRAIEKNILVVSTVEPGPAARRSENGAEGLVNGTLDDEAQAAREVETETWPKECAVASVGADDAVLPAAGKQPAKTNETSQIRAKSDEAIPRADDSDVARVEAAEVASTAVSPPEVGVMNEDTNSQPDLDSEADASESPASRKLQTTFRTKDFARKEEETRDEVKAEKSRVEADEGDVVKSEETRSGAEKTSFQCRNPEGPTVDGLPEKRARVERPTDDTETVESAVEENAAAEKEAVAEKTGDREILPAEAPPSPKVIEGTAETTSEEPQPEIQPKIDEPEAAGATKKEVIAETSEDAGSSSATQEDPRPIVEEPSSDEPETRPVGETAAQEEQASGVTIEETMDDDTRLNDKSIIPDPIPIIEEPKELETSTRNPEITTVIEEIPEAPEEPEVTETRREVESPANAVREINAEVNVREEVVTVGENCDDITDVRCTEETTLENKTEPAESMEVDGEESLPAFQRDEPMEQEAGEMAKS